MNLASFVQAEAKIETKPFEAEQNFELLKKNTLDQSDTNDEGSGDKILDDEEDYEDYYDEDEYYDDLEDGSGFGTDLEQDEQDLKMQTFPGENPTKVDPDDDSDDFHFMDNNEKSDIDENDLLYEYYNEINYGDDDDDLDYLEEVEKDLSNEVTKTVVIQKNDIKDDIKNVADQILSQPSYIFVMLSSALFSFAVFTVAFILCRRSLAKRGQKSANQMVPFIVSSHDFNTASKTTSTPIVKNYQRVPSTTKELMLKQQSTLEMGLNETQKPLLR